MNPVAKELRRSALEDECPLSGASDKARQTAMDCMAWSEWPGALSDNELRIFYLLVAEALE